MKNFFAFLFITSFLTYGCGSEGEEIEVGSIYGKIKIYDFFESEMEASAVQVEVWKDDNIISSKTSTDGSYLFEDLPKGVYELRFSKNLYGTFKVFDVTNNELVSDTIETVSLGQIPPSEIELSRIEFFPSSDPERVGFWHTTYFNHENNFLVHEKYYFHTESDVTFENHKFYASGGGIGGKLNDPSISAPQFKFQAFYNVGFVSGEKIYVIAYPDNSMFFSYVDKDSNKTIFPNVGPPSEVKSFILP